MSRGNGGTECGLSKLVRCDGENLLVGRGGGSSERRGVLDSTSVDVRRTAQSECVSQWAPLLPSNAIAALARKTGVLDMTSGELEMSVEAAGAAVRLRTLMKTDPALRREIVGALRGAASRYLPGLSEEVWETLVVASPAEVYDGQAHVVF